MKLQDEINKIIFDNNLTESWIASEIGVSPQKLHFQLHNAKNIDYKVYSDIKSLMKRASVLDEAQSIKKLSDLTLQLNSNITFQLSSLTKEILKDIQDNDLSYDEKARIKFQIRELEDQVKLQISSIKDLIGE